MSLRFSTALVSVLLAATAVAQVSIPPHSAVYNGFTRGFGFTAQTDFLIVQLELPVDAYQAGDTAGFMVRVNGVEVLRSVGNTTANITTSLTILTGDVVDVWGNWSPAVTGNFTAHNSYSAAGTPFATTIEGVAHTLNRTGWQWDIGDAAYLTGGILAPSTGQIGRILMYTSAVVMQATNTSVGKGCIGTFNSFYQLFANASLSAPALTGNALFLAPTASGYVGSWLPGGAAALYVPPVAPTVLPTGDDGTVVYNLTSGSLPTPYGSFTALNVSGNGIIGFGAGPIDYPGTFAYTPTAGGCLNSSPGGVYAWHDYNAAEAGSGPVEVEQVPGFVYVTYAGVENYSAAVMPNPSTLQFQFDLSSGNIIITFVSIDADTTSPYGSSMLVGVSAPGASLDPGSIDLTTASAAQMTTVNPEIAPLSLAAATRAILGTNWNLTVGNIPATTVFGLNIFGVSDPGLTDLFFLGMPGCQLRANLDIIQGPWFAGGATYNYSFAIPATPTSLIGIELFAQAATFGVPPVNAFGAITSNGMKGTLGDY